MKQKEMKISLGQGAGAVETALAHGKAGVRLDAAGGLESICSGVAAANGMDFGGKAVGVSMAFL